LPQLTDTLSARVDPRVAAPFKAPPVNSSLQLFTSVFLIMSQSRSQSAAAASPSPFVRIQYEGLLRDLPTLRGSLERVADKGTALSWAGLFGKLMVRRRLLLFDFAVG
jgi:hypothetical protein